MTITRLPKPGMHYDVIYIISKQYISGVTLYYISTLVYAKTRTTDFCKAQNINTLWKTSNESVSVIRVLNMRATTRVNFGVK